MGFLNYVFARFFEVKYALIVCVLSFIVLELYNLLEKFSFGRLCCWFLSINFLEFWVVCFSPLFPFFQSFDDVPDVYFGLDLKF